MLTVQKDPMKVTIKVPATSANLGPGFDTLGLALDLWNETSFSLADAFSIQVCGEGADKALDGRDNLILRAAQQLAEAAGKTLPPVHIDCTNRIPFGSGLGSSAAATLTGLLGANALLESPLSNEDILNLAMKIEGHPDNVAPALLGGLVVSTIQDDKVLARKIDVNWAQHVVPLQVMVVVPDFHFSTREARVALPKHVTLKDAVHNISRAVLVTEAFRSGDLSLLAQAMDDKLHQPHRLPLIPGAVEAMKAAKEAGAEAVALSGAGPSLIAFASKTEAAIGEAMKRAFEAAGLTARIFPLGVTSRGAEIL